MAVAIDIRADRSDVAIDFVTVAYVVVTSMAPLWLRWGDALRLLCRTLTIPLPVSPDSMGPRVKNEGALCWCHRHL
jgi:hypothetical protein